jgi:hypothetical protein
MGKNRKTPRQRSFEVSDEFPEVRISATSRVASEMVPPEIEDDYEENSDDGSLSLGNGCSLTQHPTGYGPDL